MKIGAVVCEYNPFHYGHQYQILEAKKTLGLDAVVGVMSGNFVQRGDPAVYPKALRAKAAISGGVHLVLELPAVLTLQSAERYAASAVKTLDAMGCVDTLFFGAEDADITMLTQIAAALCAEDADFSAHLKAGLAQGMSYAAARSDAVQKVLGPASAAILCRPNNILAVEYIKALLRLKSRIKPAAIARRGAAHDAAEPDGIYASASILRERIRKGESIAEYLPENIEAIYRTAQPFLPCAMEKAQLANLALMPVDRLREIADVSEGLENALKRAVFTEDTLDLVIAAAKSKRYAYSRIRRIILNAYLGITKADARREPCYIRILDFDETGRSVLHLAKKTALLPLAKNGAQVQSDPAALALWRREMTMDRLYQIFSPPIAKKDCIMPEKMV